MNPIKMMWYIYLIYRRLFKIYGNVFLEYTKNNIKLYHGSSKQIKSGSMHYALLVNLGMILC